MLSREDNRLLTETGPQAPMGALFRRFWTPALLSSELPRPDGDPRRVRILGEDFIAFRDTADRVGIVEPQCPHRGADLYYGRNEEGGLRCVYHGWKFDARGRCLELPTLDEGPARDRVQGRLQLRALPVIEAGDIVWAYLGPGDPPPLSQLEFLSVPPAHRYVSKKLQECNWAQACEGGLDTAHFSYLHMALERQPGDVAAMNQSALYASGNPKLIEWMRRDGRPKFTVEDHSVGVVIGGARRTDGDDLYWRVSQFLLPNHGLTPAGFHGENYHGQTWVPIDDRSCWIYCYTWNPVRPITEEERAKFRKSHAVHAEVDEHHVPLRNRTNDYLLDRADQRQHSYTGIRGVSEQDACIQDSQGFIADRTREHLGPTDAGIVRFRKCVMQAARDLAEGREPAAAARPQDYHVRSGSAVAPGARTLEEVMVERFGHRTGWVAPAGNPLVFEA